MEDDFLHKEILARREKEKALRKEQEDAKRRQAAAQALAGVQMSQQLKEKREERERQERIQREEAAKRELEMKRKRERLDAQRLKREKEELEETRQSQTVLYSLPSKTDQPSSKLNEQFTEDNIREQKDTTDTGTSSRPKKLGSTTASSNRNAKRPSRGNDSRRLKIVVRPMLSWRSDPEQSFSDWKIEVRTMGERTVDFYHVHRNIVGFGPRKSGYFAKQFLKFNHQVRTNPTLEPMSKLILPTIEAKVFSFALDYLYLTEGQTQPTLTAESACGVYKLAQRLEIPTLQATITEFYRKHLNVSNMGKFLRAANVHQVDQLAFVAKARIGSLITGDPSLARLIKPTFLAHLEEILSNHRQQVMQHVQRSRPEAFESLERAQAKRWSRAIYFCSIATGNTFTADILEQVLSEKSLPAIDGTVALEILDLYTRVIKTYTLRRQNLERRCAKGIMDDWLSFRRRYDSPEKLQEAIESLLPPKLVREILNHGQNR